MKASMGFWSCAPTPEGLGTATRRAGLKDHQFVRSEKSRGEAANASWMRKGFPKHRRIRRAKNRSSMASSRGQLAPSINPGSFKASAEERRREREPCFLKDYTRIKRN